MALKCSKAHFAAEDLLSKPRAGESRFEFPDLLDFDAFWSVEDSTQDLSIFLHVTGGVMTSPRFPGRVPHHAANDQRWYTGVPKPFTAGSPQVVCRGVFGRPSRFLVFLRHNDPSFLSIFVLCSGGRGGGRFDGDLGCFFVIIADVPAEVGLSVLQRFSGEGGDEGVWWEA